MCGEFGITGYPTLKVFRNGIPSDYTGPRKADGIISYMIKCVGDAFTLAARLEADSQGNPSPPSRTSLWTSTTSSKRPTRCKRD